MTVFVPDGEVQHYLLAADAVVLPFKEILTSGSAMLALSFGRPVVAPHGWVTLLISSESGKASSTTPTARMVC